jgi:hypothetical protein
MATDSKKDDSARAAPPVEPKVKSSFVWTGMKLFAAASLLVTAYYYHLQQQQQTPSSALPISHGRRLQALGDAVPSYMKGLMDDLVARKKLFDETPPEEVKYWFEYTGPLQVSLDFVFIIQGKEDSIMHSSAEESHPFV